MADTELTDGGGGSIIGQVTNEGRAASKARGEGVQPGNWTSCTDNFESLCADVADTESAGAWVDQRRLRRLPNQGDLEGRGKEAEGSAKSRLDELADGISPNVDEGLPPYLRASYWEKEPEGVPRVTEEKEQRTERIKRLGNAVVPLQARTAFLKLWNNEI